MSDACCLIGAQTNDNCHEGTCPAVDHGARNLPLAEMLKRPFVDGEPNPDTGRVIRWKPGPYMTDVGGHLWRSDRGPYAICHREGCRLLYPNWSGDPCPAAESCKNCGLPIKRERHKPDLLSYRPTRSPSGWTHGGGMRDDWQGIRCPGRLTGAEPTPREDA